MEPKIEHKVVQRFLRYAGFDTQSREDADTYPSTEKQKTLGKILVEELREMGLADAGMDDYGYVTATLPATAKKKVPVMGLIAHMDTSPDVSGAGVKPLVHRNYQGEDIVLPGDPSQVIRESENPHLRNHRGHDIITSDGTTLLGADDKAGVAEIADALEHLAKHPEIEHGAIRVAFTPDEEVGQGTKHFDVRKFGADFAYTVDGSTAGEIEDETFCGDAVTITFHGVNMHPGLAKDRLTSSLKVAAEVIARLPKDTMSPETTAGRDGFLHPTSIQGAVDRTVVKFIARDFAVEGLHEKESFLRRVAEETVAAWPGARMEFKVEESYRNMKYKLDEDPRVVERALEAVRRAGLEPVRHAIRGGTDGSHLSYQGLPTPNIFTGGHNYHSPREWIAVPDMEKAVETIVHLARIWAEES